MMRIVRNGSRVQVEINTELPIQANVVAFYVDRGNEFDAALLDKHLNDLMAAKMRDIRREEYERGWKDRGSKKTKANWWNGGLP